MNTEKTVRIFNPEDDGITHINIWFKGKTVLGQMLSSFYEMSFVHPYFGPFNSIEGFWHYVQGYDRNPQVRAAMELDKLHYLSGIRAKNFGKTLEWHFIENFRDIIIAACYYKITQNEELKDLFLNSKLPFDSYYLHTPDIDSANAKPIAIKSSGSKWLVEGFENIRVMLQYNEPLKKIDYESIFSDL